MANNISISGRVSSIDELKHSKKGSAFLTFNVAFSVPTQKTDEGWEYSEPVYVRCVSFGKSAEGLVDVLRVGLGVNVEGRLNVNSSYTRNNGDKVPACLSINVERVGLDVTYGDREIGRLKGEGDSKPKAKSQSKQKKTVVEDHSFDDDLGEDWSDEASFFDED